ncbi:MAG: Asp-tRNA(Asn)/Glu-tRNA(Gln) amidotransferase subunit GatC [Planctomycetota bacterium]
MAKQITEAEVRQVAKLGRLSLTDTEVAHFAKQLSAVVGYVSQLDELDLEGVLPLYQPGDAKDVTREDIERPGLSPEAALANAPAARDGFFQVPRVLGDGAGA